MLRSAPTSAGDRHPHPVAPREINPKGPTGHPPNGRPRKPALKWHVIVSRLGKGDVGGDGIVRSVMSPPASG